MNKMHATIKALDTKAAGPGEFEAILSVPVPDRDGEVVDAKAFDPLPSRINIDIDHEMRVEKTVGSGVPYYDGDILKIKGTFASTPLGQDVRTLVTEGHIDSLSVAYMDAIYEVDKKDGLPHLRKGKLLNAGIVSIPANTEALITMSKNYAASAVELAEAAMVKSGARHSSADYAHIQAAHDALAALGAECTTKSPEASDEPPTETEKAAVAADTKSPAAPAEPRVDVAALTAAARRAVAVAAARRI